jgi:hypothetical protein
MEVKDGKEVGAVKVIPIDGCYLRARHERLLGYKRKTANAFRAARVTNKSKGTPSTFTPRRRADADEKCLKILVFVPHAETLDRAPASEPVMHRS